MWFILGLIVGILIILFGRKLANRILDYQFIKD